jgi:SAM-dependent methyltransferase
MSVPFRMYSDLAVWWPLLSPPSEYVEEAADLLPSILAAPDAPPATLLELGSGGGSLAFHLKATMRVTLSDLSPEMLAASRQVNPDCEHVEGDMRTLALARTFDVVLVHDAIMYATTPVDARAVLATAARHCRPGGGIVLVPDFVAETFEADENTGGHEASDGRGLRYIERKWDPDPADHTYETVYDFVMKQSDGTVRELHEVHTSGLFSRADWLAWLHAAGFDAASRIDPWQRDVFVGRKRPGAAELA